MAHEITPAALMNIPLFEIPEPTTLLTLFMYRHEHLCTALEKQDILRDAELTLAALRRAGYIIVKEKNK